MEEEQTCLKYWLLNRNLPYLLFQKSNVPNVPKVEKETKAKAMEKTKEEKKSNVEKPTEPNNLEKKEKKKKEKEKEKKTPLNGFPGTPMERTFVALKPDAVQRGGLKAVIGPILSTFEQKGLKLVAMKMVWPTLEKAEKHYEQLKSMPFYNGLCSFFSSSPIIAMIWEGDGVISLTRKLLGETKPSESPPSTIRGDWCLNVGRNLLHCSDKPESAEREIRLWFKQAEVHPWKSVFSSWIYE